MSSPVHHGHSIGPRYRAQTRLTTRPPVLLDPSVASSPVDKKVAFLQAKNLTQEEIGAALGRVGVDGAQVQPYTPPTASAPAQPPQYYGQYPPPYPPYGWQQPPPQPLPKRDWRDWFIMATVVSGVSYGLFSLGKVSAPDFSVHCGPSELTHVSATSTP